MDASTTLPAPARRMTLTEDHIARVWREIPDTGDYRPGLIPMTEEDQREIARKLQRELGDDPLWLFAYGSLIWNPAFEHTEMRRATAHGWHRSFCLDMDGWRATPEQRGLMMALAPGGACVGAAYRLPDDGDREEQLLRLVQREMYYKDDLRWLRWMNLRAGSETIRALGFYCAFAGAPHLVTMPLADQAHRIARACGPRGTNAEYLLSTVTHLEQMGIHDRYLWRMQKLVADEIDAHSPPAHPA